ncbi:hypothetical protein XELAEV_18005924mg [Xenopus laevis]|uniref:Uncharacterized protein n=1 Tax=Xenopus laevis TaxID=8355 RepID=A0A974E066_XENLA|nr:hypothetical protein XELAEV_18005924mg [Xenopus laevis]
MLIICWMLFPATQSHCPRTSKTSVKKNVNTFACGKNRHFKNKKNLSNHLLAVVHINFIWTRLILLLKLKVYCWMVNQTRNVTYQYSIIIANAST